MIAFLASLYFFRDWYFVQYNKCVGFYYVNKGDKAYRKAKYQTAVNNYKKALKHYPGHSRASCNLGNIYVSFENYHEAVNAYENALRYSPNFMVCRMDLGIILSERLADYDNAIQEYGKVVDANPFVINIPFVFNNKKTAATNRGLAYYNMGIAYRGKAIFNGEDSSLTIKYLKKARESYKNAEKYLKNDFDNTYNLALTNHLLGDNYEAAKEYCKAININPENFDSHYNFAMLLRTMGLNKEALSEFEKTILLSDSTGNNSRAKYILGMTNEMRRRILAEGGNDYLKEKQDYTSLSADNIRYTGGKVLFSKQKDTNLKQLLKCDYKDKFEDM